MKTIRATLNGLSIKVKIGPGGIVIKQGRRTLKAPPPEPLALTPVQRAARQRQGVEGQIMEIYREVGMEWLWDVNPFTKYSFDQLAHHLSRLESGKVPWRV